MKISELNDWVKVAAIGNHFTNEYVPRGETQKSLPSFNVLDKEMTSRFTFCWDSTKEGEVAWSLVHAGNYTKLKHKFYEQFIKN